MAILANPSYFEQEQQGNTEQVLVAVRYTGKQRFYSNASAWNQGRWPDETSFRQDTWYVGFVPEYVPDGDPGSGLAWFERSSPFEVELSPEGIAAILLEKNYLDLEPGGPIGEGETVPGFDRKLQEALGLQDPVDAGASYTEQLKDLAGVDEAPVEDEDLSREDELVNEYDRGELKAAVKAVREDAEEFSLRGVSMDDMAEFLVDKDVEGAAVDDALRGGD